MIKKALDRALKNAKRIDIELGKAKIVVISDQHIGDGKRGSDDFQRNRSIYIHSLDHYYENESLLISLGDCEELWECDFDKVFNFNRDVYERERKFFEEGRLIRIFGNHDRFWNIESFKKTSSPYSGLEFHEAILINEMIFISHGHQGELASDILWRISRWIVRNIWKPFQRITGIPSNTAAENWKVRDAKEAIFYEWAKERGLLFIAGHTHRAMFESLSKIDRMRIRIEELERRLEEVSEEERIAMEDEIQKLKEKIEKSLLENRDGKKEIRLGKYETVPCYFNSGCCLYTNGITAIEMEEGMIRLVKWEGNSQVIRKVFEEGNLFKILKNIKHRR
ncbi:MAG: metallophosphoesterase [Candidatus Aminicenantia bacterium]